MLLKLSVLLTSASFVAADPTVVDFDKGALRFSCSDASATPSTPLHVADIDTTYSEVTVLLDPIGDIGLNASSPEDSKGRMCVLSRWTKALEDKAAGQGYYYPLGRSVDGIPGELNGNDGDWNRPAGHSAWQLGYSCGVANNTGTNFAAGEYMCEVTLPKTSKQNLKNPMLTDELNTPYYVTYYERALSVRNELARFLHLTTFGPTSSELDALEETYASIKDGTASARPGGKGPGKDADDTATAAETTATDNTTDTSSTNTTAAATSLSHSEAMSKLQIDW
eukprot:scaffold514_cov150-Skeletonema_dohrnii-CCMP3373.AAC.4